MTNFRIKITFSGWPWQFIDSHWMAVVDQTTGQRYGWNPFSVKGCGRFGGGWAFKVGITVSSSFKDWIFDLGIGSVRIKLFQIVQT